MYMVRDPELIKRITVKDFDHFSEHRQIGLNNKNTDEETHELMSKALSMLTGQKWKDMRTTLSPIFTGSKMRQMFELIIDYADDMITYLHNNDSSTNNNKSRTFDMKDLFSKYTNDVIATCAFGIKVNSFQDPANDFFVMGKKVMSPNKWLMMVKFLVLMYLPKLAKLLNIKFFSENVEQFFRSLIVDTMRVREEQNIIRPDMIHLLMQSRKGNLKHDAETDEPSNDGIATVSESLLITDNISSQQLGKNQWSDDYLIAQCLLFFFAGFETSANLLAFVSYEIATNPEVQRKLAAEIDKIYEEKNGKLLTYNDLQSMKYLDMVVSETLRKWPPAPMTDRACIKDYKIDDDQTKFVIEKGQYLWIPVIGLHYNPEYFPNPDKYDPERFNDENIKNIVPGTYIPFGIGPRNCIGKVNFIFFIAIIIVHFFIKISASRFALMSVKTIIVQLVKNFTFDRCDKTLYPMKMGKFRVLPDEGIHLELKPRQN